MRGSLVIVFGLPGSGKSFFAARLAEHLHMAHVSSDTVRTEMEIRGQYSDESRLVVYDEMKRRADKILSQGHGAVIDATFSVAGSFDLFTALSEKHARSLILFRIIAEESLIKERLRTRRSESEADYQVYIKLKQSDVEPSLSYHPLTSTNDNIDEMIEAAVAIIQQYDARPD